jgi:CDP-diacylglycerol---glycerol-3-phosphate 3-phosphatidyltransferase
MATIVQTMQIRKHSANALLCLGLSPNAVTVAGTAGVVIGSVVFGARGHLILSTVIVSASVAADSVDGTMARISGRASTAGAFLDSFLDRVADGSIYCSLAYLMFVEGRPAVAVLALLSLTSGYLVSYARARAEGLGYSGTIGFAHRFNRLKLTAIGIVLEGLGVRFALAIVLILLVTLSFLTAGQRVRLVFQQAAAEREALDDGPVQPG